VPTASYRRPWRYPPTVHPQPVAAADRHQRLQVTSCPCLCGHRPGRPSHRLAGLGSVSSAGSSGRRLGRGTGSGATHVAGTEKPCRWPSPAAYRPRMRTSVLRHSATRRKRRAVGKDGGGALCWGCRRCCRVRLSEGASCFCCSVGTMVGGCCWLRGCWLLRSTSRLLLALLLALLRRALPAAGRTKTPVKPLILTGRAAEQQQSKAAAAASSQQQQPAAAAAGRLKGRAAGVPPLEP
jgi:hypothetical protein